MRTMKKPALQISGSREFQIEETIGANVLRWGPLMASLKKSQKVGMAGEKGAKKTAVEGKIKKVTAGQLAGPGEPF